MNGNLAEPPTFWPFPGIFITFPYIASRTSQNKMRNVIRCIFTSNRECVVNMKNMLLVMPFKFILAIVAFVSLSLQLLLNLCSSIGPWYIFLSCFSEMGVNTPFNFRRFFSPVSFLAFPKSFWISSSTIAISLMKSLSVFISPFCLSLTGMIYIPLTPSSYAFAVLFWISLAILNLFCINTNFASMNQPVAHGRVFVKKHFGKGINLSTIFAFHRRRRHFFGLSRFLHINLMSACIAVTIQCITAFSSMVWEKFIGCLQYSLAFTASSITFWKDFCCSSLFLTTLLASVSQSIPTLFLSDKEIFGFREKEFTVFALLQWSTWKLSGFVGDLFKWLSIQIIKIKCALTEVLRYTGIHSRNQHFLLSRLECLQGRCFQHRYNIARQNHIQFNHIIIPRSRSPSNFIAILHA